MGKNADNFGETVSLQYVQEFEGFLRIMSNGVQNRHD